MYLEERIVYYRPAVHWAVIGYLQGVTSNEIVQDVQQIPVSVLCAVHTYSFNVSMIKSTRV